MKMIEELRAENLARLAHELGSVAALASRLSRSESQVSQWINQSINFGTGKPRSMRSSTARWIEEVMDRPLGWLDADHDGDKLTARPADTNVTNVIPLVESNVIEYNQWPFPRVDKSRFTSLPQSERDFIEGQLLGAIESAESRLGKRSVPDAL